MAKKIFRCHFLVYRRSILLNFEQSIISPCPVFKPQKFGASEANINTFYQGGLSLRLVDLLSAAPGD